MTTPRWRPRPRHWGRPGTRPTNPSSYGQLASAQHEAAPPAFGRLSQGRRKLSLLTLPAPGGHKSDAGPCLRPVGAGGLANAPPTAPTGVLVSHQAVDDRSVPAMPRPRYRQDPLPIGPDAPQVELFGPEQPNHPGLELMQQGHLEVLPLGPLFEGNQKAAQPLASEHLPC